MSFENNIKKMYSEFDEGQKEWFRFELPKHLGEWMMGGFNGKQLSKNPKLIEDYVKHEISISAAPKKKGALDNLLLALWCIRKCHGPIHAPKLYRLTKINDLSETAKTVTICAKSSLKPITSWSSNENVIVHDREDGPNDYILRLDSVESKYILGTADIVYEFVEIVLKNVKLFNLGKSYTKKYGGVTTALKEWKMTLNHIRGFLDEREYLIYLHPGEELKAAVHKRIAKPVPIVEDWEMIPDSPEDKKPLTEEQKQKSKSLLKIQLKNPQPKVEEPNPFNGPGLKNLTPKQQVNLVRAGYLKEKKKPDANLKRVEEIRQQWMRMIDYADRYGIDLK